ncbi:MAG: tetraacyldisaccharide 4'-kinase [Holophagaceae bacterium]|nr:tetraacyldisaccharide 4'-kinase [Holophagaceae bacterium]
MTLLRWLAAPLSPFYGAVVRLRNRAFDAHPERASRAGAPVISVGNLSTGGTGKTPLTLLLAESLQAAGWANAVISRGYGGKRAFDVMDVNPDSKAAETGDEPLLMARRLGAGRVVVARERAAGAARALALNSAARVLLLDDGFQHRALHRDLDLLVLDGVRRWGNGKMLPMGDLREPQDSAKRAHALVVTRGGLAPKDEIEAWWKQYGSGGPAFYVDFAIGALRAFNPKDGPRRLEVPAKGQGPLFAFCGLGHPEAFFADLLVAGLSWVGTKVFRDHHAVRPRELWLVQEAAAKDGAAGLVCTEKDAVKFGPEHLEVLQMPLWIAEQKVTGADTLLAWVQERLASLARAQEIRA